MAVDEVTVNGAALGRAGEAEAHRARTRVSGLEHHNMCIVYLAIGAAAEGRYPKVRMRSRCRRTQNRSASDRQMTQRYIGRSLEGLAGIKAPSSAGRLCIDRIPASLHGRILQRPGPERQRDAPGSLGFIASRTSWSSVEEADPGARPTNAGG